LMAMSRKEDGQEGYSAVPIEVRGEQMRHEVWMKANQDPDARKSAGGCGDTAKGCGDRKIGTGEGTRGW